MITRGFTDTAPPMLLAGFQVPAGFGVWGCCGHFFLGGGSTGAGGWSVWRPRAQGGSVPLQPVCPDPSHRACPRLQSCPTHPPRPHPHPPHHPLLCPSSALARARFVSCDLQNVGLRMLARGQMALVTLGGEEGAARPHRMWRQRRSSLAVAVFACVCVCVDVCVDVRASWPATPQPTSSSLPCPPITSPSLPPFPSPSLAPSPPAGGLVDGSKELKLGADLGLPSAKSALQLMAERLARLEVGRLVDGSFARSLRQVGQYLVVTDGCRWVLISIT